MTQELYNIYLEDDSTCNPTHKELTEEQLRETIKEFFSEVEQWDNYDKEELDVIRKAHKLPINDLVRTYHEYSGNEIKSVSSTIQRLTTYANEIKFLTSAIEKAIEFNTKWSAQEYRERGKSYYSFSVKPLFLNKDTLEVRVSVVGHLLCPSGISDNGIRKHCEGTFDLVGYTSLTDFVGACCKQCVPKASIDRDYTVV